MARAYQKRTSRSERARDVRRPVRLPVDKPETWEVQNYDGIERGEISLQEALWKLDNTVFADLAMNVGGRGLKNGPEKIADVARRLRIFQC